MNALRYRVTVVQDWRVPSERLVYFCDTAGECDALRAMAYRYGRADVTVFDLEQQREIY